MSSSIRRRCVCGLEIVIALTTLLTPGAAQNVGTPRGDARKTPRTDPNGDPLPAGAIARLGSQRLSVTGHVVSLAWSPDGKRLATGTADRLRRRSTAVTLWDATTGRLLKRMPGAVYSQMTQLRFSRDGKTLIGSGFYGSVKWDATTGKSLSSQANTGLPSPDGKTRVLRTGNDRRRLQVQDAGGRQIATIQVEGHRNGIGTVAYSPDGKTLATGTYDGQLHLWHVRSGKAKFQLAIPHKSMVAKVAFTPDGRQLAAAGYIDGIHIFNTATGKHIRTIQAHERHQPINTITISPDGKWIASAGRDDDSVAVHAIADGKRRAFMPAGIDEIKQLAFSPDGSKIAVGAGDRSFSSNQKLGVWDVATGKELLVQPGHKGPIHQVVFSPDGDLIATAGRDGTVRLWKAKTGRQVASLRANLAVSLAFSPDGWLLGSADREGAYKLWEVSTAEEIVSRSGDIYDRIRGRTTAFSPELGKIAIGGEQGQVTMLDTSSGKKIRTIAAHGRLEVNAVSFSPDGKLLATAAGSRFGRGAAKGSLDVAIWDVKTGKFIRSLKNPDIGGRNALSRTLWSPDGQTVAAKGSSQQLYLWDARGIGGAIKVAVDSDSAVAFSSDGKALVVAPGARSRRFSSRLRRGTPTKIRLIEVTTGQNYLTLPDTKHPITAIALSPRGDALATALGDVNNVVLWKLSPPDVKQPDDGSLQSAWNALRGRDAEAAYRAMWTLIAGKDRSLKLIREGFRPSKKPIPVKRIRELIGKLGDAKFAVRQKASAALLKIGAPAEPQLRAALAKASELEVKRRIEVLLKFLTARLQRLSGEPLRRIRAIQALERIDTTDSRRFLQKLVKGPPRARETIDAGAALKRIDNVRRGR